MMVRLVLALLAALLVRPAAAQTCNAAYGPCLQDFSANAATVPLSGYVLIATVPASARTSIEVDNQSTGIVQVVRDDGNGNGVSSIMLAGAAVPGGQGGSWSSTTFKGRLRVWAPSPTAQVAVFQE